MYACVHTSTSRVTNRWSVSVCTICTPYGYAQSTCYDVQAFPCALTDPDPKAHPALILRSAVTISGDALVLPAVFLRRRSNDEDEGGSEVGDAMVEDGMRLFRSQGRSIGHSADLHLRRGGPPDRLTHDAIRSPETEMKFPAGNRCPIDAATRPDVQSVRSKVRRTVGRFGEKIRREFQCLAVRFVR